MLSATLVARQSRAGRAPVARPGGAARTTPRPGRSTGLRATSAPLRRSPSASPYTVFVAQSETTASPRYAKADGKPLWTHRRAPVSRSSWRPRSPMRRWPASSATDLVALDPGTGDVRWTASAGRARESDVPGGISGRRADGRIREHRPRVPPRRHGRLVDVASCSRHHCRPSSVTASRGWGQTPHHSSGSILRRARVLSQTPVASPPQAIVSASGEAYVAGHCAGPRAVSHR